MDELLKLFNISALDDHEIGHLMWVLNSPSYERVFAPYLRGIRDSSNKMLLDRSQARKDKFPDDYLAGVITTIDGLLNLFERIIHETDMERIRESQSDRTDEQEHMAALTSGQVTHSGVNKADDPTYRPEEDY